MSRATPVAWKVLNDAGSEVARVLTDIYATVTVQVSCQTRAFKVPDAQFFIETVDKYGERMWLRFNPDKYGATFVCKLADDELTVGFNWHGTETRTLPWSALKDAIEQAIIAVAPNEPTPMEKQKATAPS